MSNFNQAQITFIENMQLDYKNIVRITNYT